MLFRCSKRILKLALFCHFFHFCLNAYINTLQKQGINLTGLFIFSGRMNLMTDEQHVRYPCI